MNEHEMCCGTVANKARLCAEIEQRDQRIKNLELCEDARARVAGRTLKFAMERGYNPASEENELEYIMRRFDDAEQIAAARLRRIDELVQARDAAVAQNERLRESVEVLMANSHGVAGLHLNGDIASWGELTEGGRFEEWLLALSEAPPAALAALKAQWQADGVLKFAGHAMVKYRYDFCDWAKLFANELRQRAQESVNAPNP